MDKTIAPASGRPLGAAEKLAWLLDRSCPWNFLVHARVRGPLDHKALAQALVLAGRRHPLLRARIRPQGHAKAVFHVSEEPETGLRLMDGGEELLESLCQSELRTPFDAENGPLARVAVLRHSPDVSTAVAVFHHAIGDAMSGVFFLQDLVRICAGNARGTVSPVFPLPVSGPLESLLPKSAGRVAGFFKALSFLRGLAALRARMGQGTLPEIWQKAGPGKRKAVLLMREMPIGRLLEKARAENTTVHGALAAACMTAVAREKQSGKPWPFYIASDVNLRGRLSPPAGNGVGFFITGVLTAHRREERTGFWDLARETAGGLKSGLDRGEDLMGVKMLQATERLLRVTGTGRFGISTVSRYMDAMNPGVTVLSNIGRVAVETGAPDLCVDKLGFASSFSAMATFGLHAATCGQTLCLNFVGMEPVHGADKLREMADGAVRALRENSAGMGVKRTGRTGCAHAPTA